MSSALNDFIAVLEKAKVPEETVKYIRDEMGVQSADHFADFADAKEEVAAAVTSESHRPTPAVIATLKGIWRRT